MSRGIEYASQLGLQNTMDLIKIIAWNNEQGVKVFRVTSCLFPWHSEYDLTDLPDYEGIKANLEYAGKLARDNGLDGLSMGMSGDFEKAIKLGATHIRVGTALFGERAPQAA